MAGEELGFNDELLKLLDREPFQPFDIIVTSGDRFSVTSPRQVAIGESVVVVVPPKHGVSFFRKNQIVGVEVKEPAA